VVHFLGYLVNVKQIETRVKPTITHWPLTATF